MRVQATKTEKGTMVERFHDIVVFKLVVKLVVFSTSEHCAAALAVVVFGFCQFSRDPINEAKNCGTFVLQ